MPVDKPQHTALTPIPTTAESSSAQGVGKPGFHQQLRDHIRAAVQVVREAIMRDELTQFVGAHWGESPSASLGYRNGSYRRDLATSSGQIQDLQVPRDREGKFHTQLAGSLSSVRRASGRGRDPHVWKSGPAPDIRRRSGSNAAGSRAQRKSRQSAQSHFDRTI